MFAGLVMSYTSLDPENGSPHFYQKLYLELDDITVSEAATKLHLQPETSECTLSTSVTQLQKDCGKNTPSNVVTDYTVMKIQ